MLKATRYVLGFLSTAAVLTSTLGYAATTQYPGIDCVQGGTTSPSIWYATGHAEALSTSTFECPIPQSGGALLAATVYVYDVTPVQGVSCTARAVDSYGGSGYFTSTQSTGNAFMGRFALKLGSATAPGFNTPGFKYLTCSMSTSGTGGSYIGSYAITEG